MITCHYCGNEELKKYAWVENKVYSWHCEPCQKNTTESHIEPCLACGEEFTFRYDPGWGMKILSAGRANKKR